MATLKYPCPKCDIPLTVKYDATDGGISKVEVSPKCPLCLTDIAEGPVVDFIIDNVELPDL